MPASDGRGDDLRGLWPAFENLQRRKSREGYCGVALRSMAIWLLRVVRPMRADGVSGTVDEDDGGDRPVSVMLRCSHRGGSTEVSQSKCRL